MEVTLEVYIIVAVAALVHIAIYMMVVPKKKMRSVYGKHVVVTGGSSGIGLNVALECAKLGANVTIIARKQETLDAAISLIELVQQVPDQKFKAVSLDISSDYKQVDDALNKLAEEVAPIYMLVNCAGLAICGVFEEVSVEDAHKLMDVNYFGTYNCTRSVLPKMKGAKDGIIVVTASQAALMGIYGYGPYSAAKFALRGLAETVKMESQHYGISVTLALPADTDTPGFENEEKSKPDATKIISGSGGLANPETVAKKIVSDALAGSFFSVLGFESNILTYLCCGMAPWGGIFSYLLQAAVMGPLRIVSYFIQNNFYAIIKDLAQKQDKIK